MSWEDREEEQEPFVISQDAIAVDGSEKALLCNIEGREKWIPQSVIHDDSEVYRIGDAGRLVVKYWWAEKEGLV